MCGIYGTHSPSREAAGLILSGLKALEYRGYDSTGIAVMPHDGIKLEVWKHLGKMTDSLKLPESMLDAELGVGHTRWATHGGITLPNTHPHSNERGDLTVVQNGIVENFLVLKQKLQKRGYKFVSETDTEVIVHLIDWELKSKPEPSLEAAVMRAFRQLHGSNAIVVLSQRHRALVAVRNGSPLVMGEGSDGSFVIASDVIVMGKNIDYVSYLKNGQCVSFRGRTVQSFDLDSMKIMQVEWEEFDYNPEAIGKGKYPHYLLKEVYEQPDILRAVLALPDSTFREMAAEMADCRNLFFVACGTASYAGKAGSELVKRIGKRLAEVIVASEFDSTRDLLGPEDLTVFISQSGESIDVTDHIEPLNKLGSKIAAIVNRFSTLSRGAPTQIRVPSGIELAVLATKSYTAQLAVLYLVAYAMADLLPNEKALRKAEPTLMSNLAYARTQLAEIIPMVEAMLNQEYIQTYIMPLVKLMQNKQSVYFLGRGLMVGTAFEAAMKIKESTYIHAEAFPSGESKHGPIALCDENTVVFVFAPRFEQYDALINAAKEWGARQATIIGVSGTDNTDAFHFWLPAQRGDDLAIITQIIPIQLLAYYLTLARGFDPDKPRNLAKSVTVK